MTYDEHAPDLVLNAADDILSIVVARDGALCVAEEWACVHTATEILASALASLAKQLGLSRVCFRRIACVTGPGSFTGVRLVLTTAAALRRCHDSLLGAINGLQALAWEAVLCRRPPTGVVHVVTHARKNLVHYQAFRLEGDMPLPRAPIVLMSPEECAALPKPGDLVCGDGLLRHAQLFAQLSHQGIDLCSACTRPSPRALLAAAAHATYAACDLDPTYVRACDALENLERLATRQGMSGSFAKARFQELTSGKPQSML